MNFKNTSAASEFIKHYEIYTMVLNCAKEILQSNDDKKETSDKCALGQSAMYY